jgi:ribosome-associated protein
MTTQETRHQTRLLVQAAAQACEDKKGLDTRILELDPIDSGLSDFFLITSATNDRQAVAIADEIEHRLKKEYGVMPNSVEGRKQGDWVLLDYVDFVVHRSARDKASAKKAAAPKKKAAAKPTKAPAAKKAALKKPAAKAAKVPAPKKATAKPKTKPAAKKLVAKKGSAKKS